MKKIILALFAIVLYSALIIALGILNQGHILVALSLILFAIVIVDIIRPLKKIRDQ